MMSLIIFWMITTIEDASDGDQKQDKFQESTGFSVVLHVFLPVVGLALLWGQRSIFSRLLLQLDRSCVSVFCPSLSKREKLLKWAGARLPLTWSSQAKTLSSGIPELWRDGSLLCTLINSVIPGACPNPHRHWKKPPLHAQALAYKYLGLPPMFTENELCGELTINQERNFIHYLQELQQAINNWPTNQKETLNYSSQYVARGMGLYTGEQYRKTVFYIYSNTSSQKRDNVLMYIRGPYGTRGKTTIPPFHNLKTIPVMNVLQNQLEATKILPLKSKEQKSFLKTISLDFTSLINDVQEKSSDDIPIQVDMEIDRAKVTYIPYNSGMYEINLISNGELLQGSPYNVRIINNASGIKDAFVTESEELEEKITFTKRKVLSKVIDCIDEKIFIDNGIVSKIKSIPDQNSTENDLTITAITKRNDEILKTEINCSLEDIMEEVQDKVDNDNNSSNASDDIDKIVDTLRSEEVAYENQNLQLAATNLNPDFHHKIVENIDQAKVEIVSMLDHEVEYTVHEKNSPKRLVSKLDVNLENFVKSSKKQSILENILPKEFTKTKSLEQDENNNSPPKTPVKRITSKVFLEIIPPTNNQAINSCEPVTDTSPICPDHIVPEVVEKYNFSELPVSERRKLFSKQSFVSCSNSRSSTFSESENGEDAQSKNSSFQELSVLNILDAIKQSRKDSFSEPYSLTSTTSLPNMPSLECRSEENISSRDDSFKAKRDYWERMSSRSSSTVSLIESDFGRNKMSISNKNIFNKFNNSAWENKVVKYQSDEMKENMRKSSEDVSSVPFKNSIKPYKSVDDSLDCCAVMSVQERKKILLEKQCQDINNEKYLPKKMNFSTAAQRKENKETSVGDQSQLPTKLNNAPDNFVSTEPKKVKSSFKSQFKRAINFFKNLEENSKPGKIKTKEKEQIKRRLSLDFTGRNNLKSKNRKGGSLNLPHISERFSINNLYEDVFGNKKGSFRGTPNKLGVVNSLSSFTKNFESGDQAEAAEENIKYNLFLNKSKNKKRRSIKALFDVNY